MNREDIIRMALEAKLPVNHPDWADAARRFAALVRAQEREECAKVCDEARAARLAEVIRARGQPEERNFCQRCGKRTADLTTIHTCTPPQENT
jgi:hypothetical protein